MRTTVRACSSSMKRPASCLTNTTQKVLVIDDDSDTSSSSSSRDDRRRSIGEEDDIIDRIYNRDWLTSDDILLGISVITTTIFGVGNWVTVIDPGNLACYIDSKEKTLFPESLLTSNRRRDTIANQFRLVPPQGEKLIIIPIHDDNHWSLIFYMNLSRRFYCMDSMGEYHQRRIAKIMTNFLADSFMEKVGTKITFVESIPQAKGYECGQYIFMFIYAYIKTVLLVQRDSTLTTKKGAVERLVQLEEIDDFDDRLNKFVYERCCEEFRKNFMLKFIQYIHSYLGR